MRPTLLSVLAVLVLAACFTCQKSTEPEPWGGEYTLFQVPGCQSDALARSFSEDSCFTYQFETDLLLDFCVTANCCPDTNRFVLSSEIRADTIAIAVQDTAERICRCFCPYVIHAEFYELPRDEYVIAITADTYYDTLIYVENVHRR